METTLPKSRTDSETRAWQLLGDLWFSQKPVLAAVCREFDLFPPQVMVLRTLDEPKPMREVAEYLSCNSSNLTGITDRLEDRKLVQRTADPKDRLREEVLGRIETPPESMAALSDEDLAHLGRILEQLNRP